MSNIYFTKTIKYTSGWDRERIALTDNLQLPSNHNRSFTGVIIQSQNIYDI